MGRAFAALAGVFAWAGWFSVAPAFGLPSLGPAAMFNRLLAPRADSGFWLGWAVLSLALAVAILVYFGAVQRGLLRANIVSGLVYGAVCWLVAGAVGMPLLGLADPFPVPPPPGGPDAMHGTFMMLHLGIGAPLAALIAWLLLGVVLGATADWRPDYSRRRWTVFLGATVAIGIVAAVGSAMPNLPPAAAGASGTGTPSTGAVATLPEGPVFVSVFRLPQPPGSVLGAHAHVPGFAYSLRGVETMTFVDAPTMRVGPGEAGFMGPQQVHAHLNTDDRLPAGAAAVLIVAAAALVGWLGARRSGFGPRLMATALIVLVALGALATWNPWSNDWLFLSVRPVAARGGPMPLPTATRIYESPDLGALPPGPYVETIEEITVAPGVAMDAGSTGAAVLLVLDGRVEVQPAGEPSIEIDARGATLLQPGASIEVSNVGDRPARLLKFAVMPAPITDPSSVMVVPATANIFGAGHDIAPAPGGGGGGTLPPVWQLPSGATRIVSFPSVTGEVTPIVYFESVGYNGPGGDMTSDTDVESFGGISGIVHHANGMFLVGVFLTDDPPADQAPERLDFTDNEEFDLLEPEIGQTFFIGDGTGRRYVVPPGATRLYLGFVDAYVPGDPLRLRHGEPGYYGNNAGELEVKVEVTTE